MVVERLSAADVGNADLIWLLGLEWRRPDADADSPEVKRERLLALAERFLEADDGPKAEEGSRCP